MAIGLYDVYYPDCHSSFRRSITSAQIEKSRDRRASLEGSIGSLRSLGNLRNLWSLVSRTARRVKEFRELKELKGCQGGAARLEKSRER